METDQELLDRHARVKSLVDKLVLQRDRSKNAGRRNQLSCQAGCHNFTLIGIESELDDRKLKYGRAAH